MLRSFRCKNYRSFLSEAFCSFVLDKRSPKDNRSFLSLNDTYLSKAMVVIGHNASGKTALINALAFIGSFVTESFSFGPTDEILLEPHFSRKDALSEFEVVFNWNSATWSYELHASKKRVYLEKLRKKTNHKFSNVFKRTWNDAASSYDIKQSVLFDFAPDQAKQVRQNASLISTAYQYGVPFAKDLITSLGALSTNLSFYGLRPSARWVAISTAAKLYDEQPSIQAQMVNLLKGWDLGLDNVDIDKHSSKNANREDEDVYIPFGAHRSGKELHWLHFLRESSGTQALFLLLSKLLPVLEKGGIAVIDELDAHLHVHMLEPILDLFFSKDTNPHNAQLIFTCHGLQLLNQLDRAQIMLVEKDKNCQSEAWRLDEMTGVRVDDNFYGKYMAGAYGARPNLSD